MTVHTGMFVAPLAGSPPQGMSPTDGRLVMGGLFQVAAQLVSGGGYTPSASVMQATVNQAVWSLTDVTNAQAVFFSPTDQITLTFSAAPATGGRIDLVVVKQNNVENADADSRVNVTVVTGTASGSPVAPAVPTGASKYLQVLINAGVTNMAAATWTNYMQTVYADPQLTAPTLAALNSVTGVPSQLATVTADATATNNGLYLWDGTRWLPSTGADLPHFGYLKTAAYSFTSTTTIFQWDASPAEGTLTGFSTSDQKTFTCVTPGVYQISAQATSQGSGTTYAIYVFLYKNGSNIRTSAAVTSSTGYVSALQQSTLRFAVGDTFAVYLGGGGTVSGQTGTNLTFMNVDFLHG